MFSIGQMVGGILPIFILYMIVDKFVCQRTFDDPVRGKIIAVASAYVLAIIIYGFGSANGGPWRPDGVVVYLLGAVVVGFFAIRRGIKIRDEAARGHEADAFE